MRHGCRRGFTFVESLTALVIILILAAILFPVFARAREKGHQTACGANLKNIGVALRLYSAEHYGHFPARDNDLEALVPRYLPDPEALVCPTAAARLQVVEQAERAATGTGPVAALRAEPDTGPEPLEPDGTVRGRRTGAEGRPVDYVYRGGFCDDDDPRLPVAGDASDARHNEGANYLYLDGHVKWQRRPWDRAPDSEPDLDALRRLGAYTPPSDWDTPPWDGD